MPQCPATHAPCATIEYASIAWRWTPTTMYATAATIKQWRYENERTYRVSQHTLLPQNHLQKVSRICSSQPAQHTVALVSNLRIRQIQQLLPCLRTAQKQRNSMTQHKFTRKLIPKSLRQVSMIMMVLFVISMFLLGIIILIEIIRFGL